MQKVKIIMLVERCIEINEIFFFISFNLLNLKFSQICRIFHAGYGPQAMGIETITPG